MSHAPEGKEERAPAVALRPVAPADEEFLLSVYASTRAEEMALVPWTDEQKRAFIKMQSDAQRRSYEENYAGITYSVVLCDGRPCGRLWVSRPPEEIHLLDIAVLPEFQNRGVGTVLLRQLIEESEREGLPLRHMVFLSNDDATRFYERLGFARVERHGMYWEMERRPATGRPSSGRAGG